MASCSALQSRADLLWPRLTSPAASPRPCEQASFIAPSEISPGMAHRLPRLCPSHLLPQLPCKHWTLSLIALSSAAAASYVLPVRRTSVLLTASFRFHLAMDTLAVRLALPLAGCALDFNQLVSAPCRAHNEKGREDYSSRPCLNSNYDSTQNIRDRPTGRTPWAARDPPARRRR